MPLTREFDRKLTTMDLFMFAFRRAQEILARNAERGLRETFSGYGIREEFERNVRELVIEGSNHFNFSFGGGDLKITVSFDIKHEEA